MAKAMSSVPMDHPDFRFYYRDAMLQETPTTKKGKLMKTVKAWVGRCGLCKTGVGIEFDAGPDILSLACTNPECKLHATKGMDYCLQAVVEEMERKELSAIDELIASGAKVVAVGSAPWKVIIGRKNMEERMADSVYISDDVPATRYGGAVVILSEPDTTPHTVV